MQLSPRKVNRDKAIVLGVDVGTSSVKCYAYDRFANVIGKACEKIPLVNLHDGKLEIPPDILWKNFQKAVNDCLLGSRLHASQVSCLGISTQRATFLTWDKVTGIPFHNFISWKDQRANDIADRWNSSFLIMFLKYGAFLLYMLTWITKFQIYSTLKFSSAMVLTRLFWVLEYYPEIRERCHQDRVMFGTMDTWLLWKLTGGEVHVTDASNACVTGLFDPFELQWSHWVLKIFNIPRNILPTVKNTCDTYGETLSSIFGSSIPICSLVGDQQASMFGAGCFQRYDINCTLGTGSFLSIITGSSPAPAAQGIFPLVGWTIQSKATYIAECGIHDTGPTISMMQNMGLFTDPKESSGMALSVKGTDGVYFLPAQIPLQTSVNGNTSFVGLNINTSKEQMVRSVLESISFQVCLLFRALYALFRNRVKINSFKLCGGVANNDLIVQTISDITDQEIHRLKHRDTSSLGAALLAGLHYGIWRDQDSITEVLKDSDIFSPDSGAHIRKNTFKSWMQILDTHLQGTSFSFSPEQFIKIQ